MANICRRSRTFLVAFMIIMLFYSFFVAEAAIWRMRTDKKAMRNALVRFGKRNAYRPAGEAFVGSASFGDGDAHLLHNLGMDGHQARWAAFEDPGSSQATRRNSVWLWPE